LLAEFTFHENAWALAPRTKAKCTYQDDGGVVGGVHVVIGVAHVVHEHDGNKPDGLQGRLEHLLAVGVGIGAELAADVEGLREGHHEDGQDEHEAKEVSLDYLGGQF
jgi:hypothetical protein